MIAVLDDKLLNSFDGILDVHIRRMSGSNFFIVVCIDNYCFETNKTLNARYISHPDNE